MDKVRYAAQEASKRQSQLLILPELWSSGFPLEETLTAAETRDGRVLTEISTFAKQYGLFILGTTLIKENDTLTNTATVYNNKGHCIARYDKMHLFTLMNEHHFLKAGRSRASVRIGERQCSLAICYDLRFPELFRRYALEKSEMVLLPAAWPAERIAHWRVLLQARAIENGIFMLGCNQVGITEKTVFGGYSGVVDPFGRVLVEGADDEVLLTTEVDFSAVEQAQERLPVLQDRRPDLYE